MDEFKHSLKSTPIHDDDDAPTASQSVVESECCREKANVKHVTPAAGNRAAGLGTHNTIKATVVRSAVISISISTNDNASWRTER